MHPSSMSARKSQAAALDAGATAAVGSAWNVWQKTVVPSSRHEAVTAESDVTVYAFQGCGMDWAAGGRLLTFVDAGKGSRDQGDGYVVSG